MRRVMFWLALVIILFIFVFPIGWVYLTSLKLWKSYAELESASAGTITSYLTVQNYRDLLFNTLFLREIRNITIISLVSTALVMAVSLPAAYSFARFNTGEGHLLFITISTRMFPGIVAAIPFFFLFKKFGLLDTHLGLILLYLYFNMSFATFLLYGFFREIPEELEDAAMVDGCGRILILWKIIFPLIAPGAAITAIFCIVWAWNEFLFAFLFTRTTARTITVGLSAFWGSTDIQWGAMAAGMGLAILPTLGIAWFMQRFIVRGLTFGAVKG